ncbi:MAG: hypothetical protein AMS17_05250 [Spirochaetes bacterium DG_61]|nr:MAG: hypothetical protein AMS17_05250 [Spirochaetes bacterium DG_61]
MAVDAQLSMLLEGSFVKRAENVLVFGNPGSGKTHILCALGQELILQGYQVVFRPCDLLVQELLGAKRDLTFPSMLKQFAKYDALIIVLGKTMQPLFFAHPSIGGSYSLSTHRIIRDGVLSVFSQSANGTSGISSTDCPG